jgi:hypothetical protein
MHARHRLLYAPWSASRWHGWPILLVLGCFACDVQSGPPTTRTSSSAFHTLDTRIAFLEQYVKFRRHYRQLDYSIFYRNGADGCAPSPSEWNLSLVAEVPPDELAQWTQGLTRQAARPKEAPRTGNDGIDATGVDEWYAADSRVVGVDRRRAVVVYRNWGY